MELRYQLEANNVNRTGRPCLTGAPNLTGLAIASTGSAVKPTAFARSTFATGASRTRGATITAFQTHL
jgi:hypothetical protein